MLYRPAKPRSLWGYWVIEWQGEYHIYYAEAINANYDQLSWQKKHRHIGHTVSKDLVRWEERPSISLKGKPGDWNDMAEGGGQTTGCVVRHEDKFYMFAGATKDGIQKVGVWLSDDLYNWKPHPANPVLRPAGPYYRDAPTKERPSVGWRDPGIAYCKEDGCYHMCISAMLPKPGNGHYLGSTVGHVRSKDLIHWEHLPPFDIPGLFDRFYQIEEPEMFAIAGKSYLTFDGGTTGGMRVNTPSRDDVRGSFYMIGGPNFNGPFKRPADDLLVGNGLGERCATTCRFIPYEDTQLLFHFSIARRPVLGTPKIVRVKADGTLYLEYMPVLEKLETGVIYNSIEDIPEYESQDPGKWHRSNGELSCNVKVGGSAYRVAEKVSDFHLSCTIKGQSADRAGVVLRIREQGDSGAWPQGVGIIFDYENQRIFLSDARCYLQSGWYCRPKDFCRMSLKRDKSYQLRCFVRGENLEVYLDNRWLFTTIIPEIGAKDEVEEIRTPRSHYRWGPKAASTGAVDLMAERGKAIFSGLRLASIEPLA